MNIKKNAKLCIIVGVVCLALGLLLLSFSTSASDRIAAFPWFFCVGGALALILGITSVASEKSNNKKPLNTKSGRVIEKSQTGIYDACVVEFDDGTRMQLLANKNNFLIKVGDAGTFGYKGNMIVEFKKSM